jgi:TPP-dependent pyruvate/acetoin dehydrogenase alpha subunit
MQTENEHYVAETHEAIRAELALLRTMAEMMLLRRMDEKNALRRYDQGKNRAADYLMERAGEEDAAVISLLRQWRKRYKGG